MPPKIAISVHKRLRRSYRSILRLMLLVLLLVGLLLVLIALALSPHVSESVATHWWTELGHNLLLELGIAALVSFATIVTIERYMRWRAEDEQLKRQHQIEKGVFDALFGFSVSRRLLNELYEVVNASKLVRLNCVVSFEFEALPANAVPRGGNGEFVWARTTVSYQLHNRTLHPQRIFLNPYFENPVVFDECKDEFTAFRIEGCDVITDGIPPGDLSPEMLRRVFCINGIRRQLKVGCVKIPADSSANVRYTYQAVRRRCDIQTWVSVYPAEGLRVQAVVLNPTVPLDFWLETVHREDAIAVWDPQTAGSAIHEWRINATLLPYQGFVLYWYPPPPRIPAPQGTVQDVACPPAAPNSLEAGDANCPVLGESERC